MPLHGVQTVGVQKELSDSHGHDAAVVQPRPEVVSCDDDFPERVRYVRKRALFLIPLLGRRHVQGGLHIVSPIAPVGNEIVEFNKTKSQNSPTLKNSQKFVKWGQWFNTRSNSEKVINF